MSWSRDDMIRRAATEVQPGTIVNLGIGMPTEVANYIPLDGSVTLHSENGLLGMGPYPTENQVDARLINAGKQTVTALPGASVFDSALSFAMIRGGHIDLAILGGLEVACNGDLANWTVPGKLITGMGGAMDLAAGARRVVVIQSHVSKDGKPKLVSQLTLPRDRARLRQPRDHRAGRVRHRRRLLHLRGARGRREAGDDRARHRRARPVHDRDGRALIGRAPSPGAWRRRPLPRAGEARCNYRRPNSRAGCAGASPSPSSP